MHDIVEIRNVTAYRGDTRVFDNLSLTVPRGCNTAILGPNGAGKTTLMKLLAREIYPVARADSRIRLFGQERWNVWELRARLGIVSHDLQRDYSGEATGWHVILSGFYASVGVWAHQRFSPAHEARAREIVALLGIEALKDKPYASMSTGEQRRCLLGRALVHDPEALVLDEPTSGLDLKACFQYLELVRGLMRAGKTVLLVTHHIHEIPPEIERTVLLARGRVVADGPKTEVLTSARLSELLETPIELVQAHGYYQALPAGSRAN